AARTAAPREGQRTGRHDGAHPEDSPLAAGPVRPGRPCAAVHVILRCAAAVRDLREIVVGRLGFGRHHRQRSGCNLSLTILLAARYLPAGGARAGPGTAGRTSKESEATTRKGRRSASEDAPAGPVLVISAHAGDFVWRPGGAMALASAPGAAVTVL